jgi:hypothetical protein
MDGWNQNFNNNKKVPKKNHVDKWQLMIGLFTSCKIMVSNCKCYSLVKGWTCIRWLYISSIGNVLTSH